MSQFIYLLNAFEAASQHDTPAEVGYAAKRKALLEYVEKLESARPEALRNPQDEAVRAAWDELLEKVAIQAVLPPKKGYDRRAIYLCVEDENDHGGEYVEVYDVSMEELNLLRGLLCAPSPQRLFYDENIVALARRCGWGEAQSRPLECFIEDAVKMLETTPPPLCIAGLLETIRQNESVDDNGDPVGPKPESSWEKGYSSGVRCVYRFLKSGLPDPSKPKWPWHPSLMCCCPECGLPREPQHCLTKEK